MISYVVRQRTIFQCHHVEKVQKHRLHDKNGDLIIAMKQDTSDNKVSN